MAADKASKAEKSRRILVALEQLHRVEQWKMADLERRLAELEQEKVELIGALNDNDALHGLFIDATARRLSSTAEASLGSNLSVFETAIAPRFQVLPRSSLTIVAATDGWWAFWPVADESQTGTTKRPDLSWSPCPGPVASTFQSFSGRNASNVLVISIGLENDSPSSSLNEWKHRKYSMQ